MLQLIYFMKAKLIIVLLLLSLAISSTTIFDKYSLFQKYAKEYNKRYQSKTIQFYRFAIYLKNSIQIAKLNENPSDHAVYGQTKFTDLTYHEAKQMMGLKIPAVPIFNYVQNFTNDLDYKPKTTTPDFWDWQQQGVIGPMRDQGSCGSCWTFSTVGNIESQNYLKNKGKLSQVVPYSQQQLIDCDKVNFGCSGGWPYMAIEWLSFKGGLMLEKDYPLRSNYSGPCQFNQSKQRIQISGYMNVTHDEAIIRDALYQVGPLSILLDFTGMMHYKSGIANPLLCSSWPDHALVLAGYGTKDKEDYWIIKNSWGPKWGLNGYLHLKRGANKCGINLWATTAIIKD